MAALLRQLAANARHTHQYSALVIHDTINVNVNIKIDWGDLRQVLHLVNPAPARHDGVLEWHGRSQQKIMLHTMETIVYSRPDKDLDTKINLVSARLDNFFYITAYL